MGRTTRPCVARGGFERGEEAGFAWLRVVSSGKGSPSFVRNLRPYDPPIDCTGKFIKVWIKVDSTASLGSMEFRLSSDGFSSSYFSFSSPIYADEEANVLQSGVWTPLTLGFGGAQRTGSPDRSSIDSAGWYLADRGGGAPVTAYWGGLALVDEPPEGVVSLSFDDGYDERHWAAERMARYGFRGTAYIIPDAVGQRGYMNLQQLLDLRDRFGWEVAEGPRCQDGGAPLLAGPVGDADPALSPPEDRLRGVLPVLPGYLQDLLLGELDHALCVDLVQADAGQQLYAGLEDSPPLRRWAPEAPLSGPEILLESESLSRAF